MAIHVAWYDQACFLVIKQDPNAWAIRVGKETAAKATELKPGDRLEHKITMEG